MCGLVGLHLRPGPTERAGQPLLEERLGELLGQMLIAMATRGPDSSGAAIYRDATSGLHKVSVLAPSAIDWPALEADLTVLVADGVTIDGCGDLAIIETHATPGSIGTALAAIAPELIVIGAGESIEVFKRVGHASSLAGAYGLATRHGFQGIGHTRMATESAVTTAHSHPFAPGRDVALAHNGSFSNYATVRRRLEHQGVVFDTDNDSEVAARLISRQLADGEDLRSALDTVAARMDGFYTLLVATNDEFAVVRDAFACKPAVIAETDDYVAVASEYHALTSLPGIEDADVYEPKPSEVYLWKR
jgi:glutamate synthase domain-containing protein 1